MDTRQKNRPTSKQGSRSTGKNVKKKSSGILGIGKKQPARRQNPTRQAPAQGAQLQRRTVSPEEAQRRREAAAQQRQADQTAAVQQTTVEEAIPEMVFKPGAEQQTRIRTPEENKRSAMRRRSAKRSRERQEEAKRASKRPSVTYTDPVPFNLQKLLLQLTVVVAVVLAIVMGLSVFFKVKHVVVYGNRAYSAWTIQEASGIAGDGTENLLTFGSTRACGKITTFLPYVKTARIGIKLPDTVNIYIEEFDVVYAIEASDESWWLMTSGGKLVEKIDAGIANDYTKVLGVEVDSPTAGAQAKAVEELISVPQATGPEGETVSTEPVFTVTGSDRLRAALLILEALELNDIVGEASSINVKSLNSLELMYGVRYQVKLGDTGRMEEKIAAMKQAVAQLNEYQTGILDVSFTTWTDRPGYTPFE